MSEPRFSINFTGEMLATDDPCAVGDALVYDTAEGVWRVANAANRAAANARAGAIALTDWGGSAVGKVSYQSSGILAEEISELGAGSASWVRVSAAGRLERCTPAPGDDLVGRCDADGRVHLQMGTWDSTNYAGGGGGSVTFSGDLSGVAAGPQVVERIKGTTVTTAGGALPVGAVLRTTAVGTADWGALDLADNDARTGVLPTANGGTGLSSAGSDGNVLTASGGVWVSSAPGSGAPSNAQYLTLATNASLSNERVFTPSTGLSAVDGGANGNYTLSCTFTPSSTDTLTNKTFNIISNTLTSTAVGQLLKGVSGGVYDHFARGTALQVLRVNAAGTDLEWAANTGEANTSSNTGTGAQLAKTKSGVDLPFRSIIGTAPITATQNTNDVTIAFTTPGSNTELIYNNGGALAGTGNLAYNSGGLLVSSSGFITTGAGTAAGTGIIRFGATAANMLVLRVSSTDTPVMAHDGSGTLYVGSNAASTTAVSGIRVAGSSTAYVGTTTSGYNLECTTTDTGIRFNVRGSGSAFTWKKASVTVTTSSSVSLTLSQSECPFLYLGGTGGAGTFVLTGASDGEFYIVYNGTGAACSFGDATDDAQSITNGTCRIFIGDTSAGYFRNAAAEGDI